MPATERPRDFAGIEDARHRVLHQRQLAIQHRHVDERTLAGAAALLKRGEDADRGEEACSDIADRSAGPAGLTVNIAGNAHHARERLRHYIVGGLVAIRTILAEAGERRIDQAGIDRGEVPGSQSQAIHHAGAIVFHQHVALLRELEKDGPAALVLEVERQAALVAVDAEEIDAFVVDARIKPSGLVAGLRPLDLDHIRAQGSEQPGAVGTGQHVRDIEDADALQRSGRFRRGH